MARKNAGEGGMPAGEGIKAAAISAEQALQPAEESSLEQHVETDYAAKQPDFRVVQPEYNSIEGKTSFKDVGALWKNISRKTGREFYTMKIGKLKLLVFPNQKLSSE